MQVLYERFGARDYRRIACNQPKRENRIKQENPIMITRRSAQNSSSNEYGENTSRHEAQIKYQNPSFVLNRPTRLFCSGSIFVST